MKALFTVLLFLSTLLGAQTDSMQRVITKLESKPGYQSDTNYILALNEFAEQLWRNEGFDEAEKYSQKALTLSKVAEYAVGEADAYNTIGIINWYMGNYDSAICNIKRALPIFIRIKNKTGVGSCLNNIGMLHATKGEDPMALSYFFQSLKINEETKNTRGISSCYNNIGIIYKNQKEYNKSLSYYFKSLAIDEKSKNELSQSHTLANIGVLYDLKHQPDSALHYYNKALDINKKLNVVNGLSSLYINIGVLHFNKNNYALAEENFLQAIEYAKKDAQKLSEGEAYSSLGTLYLKLNNPSKSLDYLQKSYKIALEINAKPLQRDVSKYLFEYYKKTNNTLQALKYLETYTLLKDSIFNEETRESSLKTQLQYEFEKKQLSDSVRYEKLSAKKDLELANQKIELTRERTTKYLLFGGLAFLVALSVVTFRAYTSKKAANIAISEQKKLIEEQKQVVEEKQKEILDSITYAKRLQDAILPSESIVRQHIPGNFILYKPKDIVAGDFYWMETVGSELAVGGSGKHNEHQIPNSELILIAAADCTGHGVPGAMVSVVCSNALNRAVLEFGLKEPGEILDKTRELVLSTFSKNNSDVKDGMDISLCAIQRSGNTTYCIKWAGANNPLWYFSKNEFHEIKPHKEPIGKTENPTAFPTHSVELSTGDCIYLFTDGFMDQFGGPKGKKYKSKKLAETIMHVHAKPITEQLAVLNTSFEEWKGKLEQVDDVTLIGIKL